MTRSKATKVAKREEGGLLAVLLWASRAAGGAAVGVAVAVGAVVGVAAAGRAVVLWASRLMAARGGRVGGLEVVGFNFLI